MAASSSGSRATGRKEVAAVRWRSTSSIRWEFLWRSCRNSELPGVAGAGLALIESCCVQGCLKKVTAGLRLGNEIRKGVRLGGEVADWNAMRLV
jgi:hypothetical protein